MAEIYPYSITYFYDNLSNLQIIKEKTILNCSLEFGQWSSNSISDKKQKKRRGVKDSVTYTVKFSVPKLEANEEPWIESGKWHCNWVGDH